MNTDVPAEILLEPPTTDIWCSPWGLLAGSLYQHGLIWRQYEQAIVCESLPQLRLTCTFTDQHAYDTWQSHPSISTEFSDVLRGRVHVSRIATPCDRHEEVCGCNNSSEFILRGHGFGHSKAVLYCVDCLGYIPRYRVQNRFGAIDAPLESWAVISSRVYDIWLATSTLEDWASTQLSDPASEINVAGLSFATKLSNTVRKPFWYYLFVPYDDVTSKCPKCGGESMRSVYSGPSFQCDACRIVY